ncbi:HAD-IIA family hydrolase [Acidipropionibacterium acidipropionici]|uniref:HAD-IIA family hydrolase n=1 Tax=Acidipropionibacterium acidipropionici TaxID=1748 RepID=UPI0004215295|nr:HAD-IIA family hydrolase [Acidipropionibacterium acidipropionici]ALN16441.1 HAD family hydrolase [Acidipropionibacterium acidipropionici]APZ10504.1 HAD family hydrolase [Acidipropionibacterium acidipropionici]
MNDIVNAPTDFQQAYVFDMDGTIYLGDHLLPGAKRMIEELRQRGIPVRFLSNNPTKDPQQYVEKLERLGLPTDISDISNTVVTTTNWLKENHPDAKVFAIAEEPLKNSLRQAGIQLSEDPEEIDIVVSSYDRGFDYRKLQIAFDAIWFHKRAFLVQTNPDRFCPFPGGRGEPDCAAMTAAIEACTGTTCQVNFGKPSPVMLTAALAGLDVDVAHCVMVGDRLATDIQMALDTGMGSACVLTGEATADDIRALDAAHRPTWVLDRIDKLIPASAWTELGWTEND